MNTRRFAVFMLLVSRLFAQQAVPAAPMARTVEAGRHRPRIGLVLEGGGALGIAHVGVIEWLEENRIPVDVIAGTSMGGLVGGFYATGKSPTELKEMIHSIHWDEVLGGVVPYPDLSFRRKEDRRDYLNAFEFGLRHGAQFPSGFNSGHQVGLILDEVTLPYSDLKSFDDLPIPFRCVATDLVSQTAHVFERGPLGQALRSTMSLPAFFSPVRSGEHTYVDGGLLDNLPADVARQMGAEIVIAVHLRTKPLSPGESLSSVGVLDRAISVTVAVNELRGMEKADILLTANLEDYTSTDYDRFSEIEAAGYRAAQDKKAVLLGLQVSEDEWRQILATRAQRRRPVPVPQFVEIKGTSEYIAKGLEHKLEGVVGQPIDTNKLDREMTAITGLGRFSRAGYHMVERNGRPGLEIQTEEKDYAPPTVLPLLFIDGSNFRNVLFRVGARITFLDLGGYGSEWRNDVIAGSEYGLSTEYFHPFTPYTRWFAAPQAFADTSPFNIYQTDRILAEYRNRRAGVGADIGYGFGQNAELRLGYTVGYQKLSQELGAPLLPTINGRFGITSLRYRLDRYDNPVIPRRGVRLESTFNFYDANPGATDVIPSEEVRFGVARPMGERSSVLFNASGGTTFGTRHVGFPPFSLGGPLRLGGYGTNELLTSQYFLLQASYLHRLKVLSPLLGQKLYLLSGYEIGKAYYQPPGVSRLPQDATLGLLVQTLFGPVFVGGSFGDRGHRKFYFEAGRFF